MEAGELGKQHWEAGATGRIWQFHQFGSVQVNMEKIQSMVQRTFYLNFNLYFPYSRGAMEMQKELHLRDLLFIL